MRNELTKGTVLRLTADDMFCEISISQTIGQGANCLVYEGEILSGFAEGARCRIKECYPSRTEISRNGSQITWENTYQRDKAFDRFKAAHSLIVSLRNEDTLGNNITNAGLFYGNGTIYSVMEMNYGAVDEQDYTEDLSVLFEEVRVLSDVIGRLHEKGYLHLDIKPQNYLVSYSPNVSVWLFDVDSISSLEELRSGTAQISCTARWAAPESFLAQRRRLAPATDLYSIGAVLFEKIMGRPVQEEDTRPWAQWNFDNTGFNNVNPLVFKKLGDIFRKTLSVSIKKRYQNAGELSQALTEIRDLAKKQPYLQHSVFGTIDPFFDREERIDAINSAFSGGHRMVFIEGMPGIGKTELLKRYALIHQKNYDVILFSYFPGSIEQLFEDIDIQNFEGTIQEKSRCLKNLLSTRVLWIIDGFDEMPANGIEDLKKLDCHILLSGSLKWDKYLDVVPCVVEEMPFDFQLQLFMHAYGSRLSASERKIAAQIVSAVKGHTLSILLLAKQIRRGFIGFGEALSDLHKHGFVGTSGEWIRYEKDGKLYYEELAKILDLIFNVEGFLDNSPDSQKKASVLRNLAMFNNFKVKTAEFADWMGAGSKRYINELIETYWIHEERIHGISYLSMHAVVAELVSRKLGCSHDLCSEVFAHIQVFANDFSAKYKTPVLERRYTYGNDTIEGADSIYYSSHISLINQYLNKHSPSEINEIIFWIDVIEKLCWHAGGLSRRTEGIWNFLCSVWRSQELRKLAGTDSEVKIATVMGLISMIDNDYWKAREYITNAFSLLNSLPNGGYEVAFRVCFTCYVCMSSLGFAREWDKNAPGFSGFLDTVKAMWLKLLENGSAVDGCISVTHADIENIYKDFLFWAQCDRDMCMRRFFEVAEAYNNEHPADCDAENTALKLQRELLDQITTVTTSKIQIDTLEKKLEFGGSVDECEKRELKMLLSHWIANKDLPHVDSAKTSKTCKCYTNIYAILLLIAVLIDDKDEIKRAYSVLMHCDIRTISLFSKEASPVRLYGGKWLLESAHAVGSNDLALRYIDELVEMLECEIRGGLLQESALFGLLTSLLECCAQGKYSEICAKYHAYRYRRFSHFLPEKIQ